MRYAVLLLIMTSFMLLPAGRASAVTSTGLWAGEATLYGVSSVSKSASNLVFDLALKGSRSWEVMVPGRSAGWLYNNSGDNLGTAWGLPDYAAGAGWTAGTGPVALTTGPVTAYFRRTFPVTSAGLYSGLIVRLLRDDGAVVYLNGVEILRSNLPAGYIGFDMYALSESSAADKTTYSEVLLPANMLRDGNNVLAVEVHRSGAADADLTFDLELLAVAASPSAADIVLPRSSWLYDDSGQDLATGWKERVIDDSLWRTGSGVFGYGNPDRGAVPGQDTVLQSGGPDSRYPAYYFRKHFAVVNPADYTDLSIFLRRNDGAVVYINGLEVLRSNMPATGTISFTTPPLVSIGPDESAVYVEQKVAAASYLQAGDNVIAVEVHQHKDELSDRSVAGPPTATPAELSLHLIFHVNTAGNVSLLKEALLMKDPLDGHTVILTDDTLASRYAGIEKREGTAMGRRLSSVSYDFAGQTVACTGTLATGGTVTCSFSLGRTHPTNPFLHRYNPQHDELDPAYEAIPEASAKHESPLVSRLMTLSFIDRFPPDQRQPAGPLPPGWNDSQTGGVFSEVLTGLHKDPITVTGSFMLRKVTDRGVLNE